MRGTIAKRDGVQSLLEDCCPPMSSHEPHKHSPVRLAEWCAMGFFVALALPLASSFWGHASDDAYITYCYARNWMETGEFLFNSNVSYGITAPGYAMLLGVLTPLGAPLGLDVPGCGSLLSILCLLYLTALLWRFTRDSSSAAIRWLPLMTGVVLFTMPLALGMWGSENMVAVSLILTAAVLLFEKDRPLSAGLVAFLGIFVRMDAGIGALMIGLVAIARYRRIPWRFGLAGVLPLAIWFPFLHSQFGSILPATLEAKRLILQPGFPTYTAQQFNYMRWAVSEPACWNLLGMSLLGLATAALRITRSPRGGAHVATVIALWVLTQEVLYRQLGIPCGPWYHLVSLFSLLVLASTGAMTVGLFAERLIPKGVPQKVCVALLMVVALGPYGLSVFERLSDKWQQPLDERFNIYHDLGTYLRQSSEADDLIATAEIGLTAYFAERPILDLCGLVSPEVVAATQDGKLAEYVRAQRPQYIVDNPMFYGNASYRSVLMRTDLKLTYRMIREFNTPEYRAGPIRLWQLVE